MQRINAPHSGACGICGTPWCNCDYQFHTITIKDNIGVFAVCEKCWKEAPAKDIIQAYEDLYDDWARKGYATIDRLGFTQRQMMERVKNELSVRFEQSQSNLME